MRKILLASSALVGAAMLAAPAFAGDLTVKLSGYDSVMGGFFEETQKANPATGGTVAGRNDLAFENIFDLNVSVTGRGSNNLEYGALISLWNGPDVSNNYHGDANAVHTDQAYVWLSNNWGKLLLGDAHGATDLFTYAPTVGTNQIDGDYYEFVNSDKLWRVLPSGVDNAESSTRITYYTPVVSGVQAGVSFTPTMYEQGAGVQSTSGLVGNAGNAYGYAGSSLYEDQVEAALDWTGHWDHAGIKLSGLATYASANQDAAVHDFGHVLQDEYLTLGVGGQVNWAGFTVGAAYTDLGHENASAGQDKDQYIFDLGGKYEWNQAAFAVDYLDGEGYNASFGTSVGLSGAGLGSLGVAKSATSAVNYDYVRDFQAIGAGATYTWFPGLVSGIDVVFFDQYGTYTGTDDKGEVVILSQRLNF